MYLSYDFFILKKFAEARAQFFFTAVFIFIIAYLLFLSLFIGYYETWPGKYLLSFILYFLFFLYFNITRNIFISRIISLAIFLIVFISQNYQYKNIYYHFTSYLKIENEVTFLNNKISEIKDKYNLKDYSVIDCGGVFPHKENNLNFFKKNKSYCLNNSISEMKKTIFIFRSTNVDQNELKLYENRNVFYAEYIQLEKFHLIYRKNSSDNFNLYFKVN